MVRASKKRIVLVVPRGEAVRNFLYSETLRCLSEEASVTVLSVITDERFLAPLRPFCDRILPLRAAPPGRVVSYIRLLTDTAHDRWLWSRVARNRWALHDARALTPAARIKRRLLKALAIPAANRSTLLALTALENAAVWRTRQTNEFNELFEAIRPDLVFNSSHIHGPAGDLPLQVASRLGIRTAGFIFSWDNLTSRSRIFVPYSDYLVWNQGMRDQLTRIYDTVSPQHVWVTGTPQFDFHFRPEFQLSREELCRQIGADPARPFILYTTGIDGHFPEEHRHVELVAQLLSEMDLPSRPQLVVRTYAKGTSAAMRGLAAKGIPDVLFPTNLWEPAWFTPLYEDLTIYSSLLRHASLGINAASTVTLELLMHDKPVVNIGFDPPGSTLHPLMRWERHIEFDHFQPVVQSGATMVARSSGDMRDMLHRGLTRPEEGHTARRRFIAGMFDGTLDGRCGERVAQTLLRLCGSGEQKANTMAVRPGALRSVS